MAWNTGAEEEKQFVKEALRIRKELLAPDAQWVPLREEAEPELFIFERRKEHTVRIILHVGEGELDTEKYLQGGRLLMQGAVQGNRLSDWGYQILEIE